MKTTTQKSIIIAALISIGFLATPAQAELESVSLLATNIKSVSVDMERSNQELIKEVSMSFSKDLISDLDSRLPTEVQQSISSAE